MRRCLNCMHEYQEKFGDTCPNCGYVDGVTLNGDVCLRPGTILQARYIVGTVRKSRDNDIFYIGWDALFDRRVQIQEYFPRYCATRSEKSDLIVYASKKDLYQKGLDLFCNQSRELIRLYKENDVVTYHACFRENSTAYAVTDYRDDQTLEEWADTWVPEEGKALRLLEDAMKAVDKAHRIGVCHGMIDPGCFWITREGRLVLKDFGSWRYVSGEPGVVSYGNAGIETDVYGLARLFCQLMTGKVIEDGDNLDMDLFRSKVSLGKDVATAMKHALSHETKSLYRFSEELGGNLGEEVSKSFLKNKSRRRDAKDTLAVPKWVYGVAAAGLAVAAGITVLVMTGVIDVHIGSGQSKLEKDMVRVPNVVNKRAKEAQDILKRAGLGMSEDRKVFSKEIPENMVSYQEIKENSLVEKGTEVVVYISMGVEKGTIPAVKGKQKEEAEKLLRDAKFTKIKVQESQEAGIFNSVLDISEEQGANVETDKEIVITVCINKTGQEGDASTQVEVPDVSGMDRGQAEAALAEAGLKVQWAEEFSDQPEGAILGQEPGAGTETNKDSIVSVRISMGAEKIYMVNVELETEEDARKTIEGMGLQVGNVTKAYSDSVKAGAVISQSVAIGNEVAKGSSVDLAVSLGKDPAKQDIKEKPKQTEAATKPRQTKPAQTAPPETTPPETAPPETSPEAPEVSADTGDNKEETPAAGSDNKSAIEVGGSRNEGAGGDGPKEPGQTSAVTNIEPSSAPVVVGEPPSAAPTAPTQPSGTESMQTSLPTEPPST